MAPPHPALRTLVDAPVQVVSGHLRWLDNPGCAFARGVAQDWSNVFTADERWERAFALCRSVCPPEGAERKPGPRDPKGG